MEQFLEGLFLQASLILALGTQNVFVLESGLKKRRHFLVATICTLCDVLLIAVGVLGAASAFAKYPLLKILFGILGVAFLFYYGFLKLREKPLSIDEDSHPGGRRVKLGVVVLQTLAFSVLNPHVVLDTVILIGGYSSKFPAIADRALFGLGAASCSCIWFYALAGFAAGMSRYLNNPKMMRIVSIISGTILILLAMRLGLDVWKWTLTYAQVRW